MEGFYQKGVMCTLGIIQRARFCLYIKKGKLSVCPPNLHEIIRPPKNHHRFSICFRRLSGGLVRCSKLTSCV